MKHCMVAAVLILFALSAVSCKQVGQILGNKDDDRNKMEEIAAKAAEMLADQQKKAAEEKARLDQQVEAEVQKRLAEERARAAETQPQTQPTAEKPAEKVVERIIVRESGSPKQAEEKLSGYVRVFTDSHLSGKNTRLSFKQGMSSTIGTSFENNITSAEYQIPPGWQVTLYEHPGYNGSMFVLSGTGSVGHLPGFINDKCSSIRWEKGR